MTSHSLHLRPVAIQTRDVSRALANPDVTIDLRDETRPFRGREATGEERARLWAAMASVEKNLDAYATRRPRGTALVVFEPRPEA